MTSTYNVHEPLFPFLALLFRDEPAEEGPMRNMAPTYGQGGTSRGIYLGKLHSYRKIPF